MASMRPSRAEQAVRTRKGIVETATRLFAERGYDGTSLQQISDEMGLTKAAVYYHFPTKAEILREIVHPSFDALEEVIEHAATARSRAERITVMVAGVVDSLIAHRGQISIVQSDPAAEHELDKDMSRYEKLLDRAAEVLYGPQPSAEERAVISIAACVGDALRRLADLSDAELREALVRSLTRLVRVR